MGIKVKHSPSAAAIGGTAYTIGRGQRIERDIRFQTEVGLKQTSLGLQARSISDRAIARRDADARQQDQLDFRRQQWEEEPALQLQRGLEQQKLLQAQESYKYTEGQKRRRAQVVEGVNWLREQVASGKWTAEQAEQAEQQLWGLYHKVIPGPVDVGPGIQQRFDSGWVTDETTGERWREQPDGKFEKEGMTREQFDKSYDSSYKTLASTMNILPTPDEVMEHMDMKAEAHARFQQRATQTKEEKNRLQQNAIKKIQVGKQREEMEAAVEALPTMFDAIVKGQPKIGRKKKGKPSWYRDDVYGEEAYNLMLTEAVNRSEQEGIPPEEVKAAFDKWWDEQYDKDRGKMFQRFGNRMEFEGAKREAAPAKRTVAPEVDLKKLDEMALGRIQKFKSGKIEWSAISKKYGQETAAELKYIIDSGNEQAIANALKRLGII